MAPQNFSVNDGDGIRTIIFFAGCPIVCVWCANPESSVGFDIRNIRRSDDVQDAEKKNSKMGAGNHSKLDGHTVVRLYSVEELLAIIEKQRLFYRFSGGGVTFSGGEPTCQIEILREMTNVLYDRGISLAIETSGFFVFEQVMDILAKMDIIFVDVKHMDSVKHKHFTGQSNTLVLENIKHIGKLGVPVVVRVPVIETVNAAEENIRQTAKYVCENLPNPQIELLPYHNFGDDKYEALNIPKPSRDFKPPTVEQMQRLEALVRAEGVAVVSYK